MSYGLLSLEPKDRDGNPIENLEDQAIMEGDRELKAWDAIARYMQWRIPSIMMVIRLM